MVLAYHTKSDLSSMEMFFKKQAQWLVTVVDRRSAAIQFQN